MPSWADFNLSESRYWSLNGLGLEEAEISARINFNGSNIGMDQDLTSQTGDSLMLLYRKDATEDWQLWPFQQKTAYGNPGSVIGWIEADSLVAGDYVLANTAQSIGRKEVEDKRSGSIQIYPNPAKNRLQLRLFGQRLQELPVRLIDMEGRVIFEKTYHNPGDELRIDLQDFSSEYVIVEAGNFVEKVHLIK